MKREQTLGSQLRQYRLVTPQLQYQHDQGIGIGQHQFNAFGRVIGKDCSSLFKGVHASNFFHFGFGGTTGQVSPKQRIRV